MFVTENGKYVKLKSAWVTENGKYVKLKKAYVTDGGKFVKLKLGNALVSRRLVASTNNSHAYSDDNGVTWTVVNYNGLTYSTSSDTNGERVIATRDGDSSSNPQITRYTLDGATWTVLNAVSSNRSSGPNYVTYVPELDKFYIILQGETLSQYAMLYESTDGISWTNIITRVAFPGTHSKVIYDAVNDIYLVSGTNGDAYQVVMYARSSDGFAYTGNSWYNATNFSSHGSVTSGIATHYGLSVTTSTGSSNVQYALYSYSGTAWTKGSATGMLTATGAIIYANGKFVRVSSQSESDNWYSADGHVWTKASGMARIYNNGALLHDGKQFIAQDSSGQIYRSIDGTSWVAWCKPLASYGTVSFLS